MNLRPLVNQIRFINPFTGLLRCFCFSLLISFNAYALEDNLEDNNFESIADQVDTGGRILDSIQVTSEQDGTSVIDIHLNQQLTVQSYNPMDGGDLLTIQVKRPGTSLQLTELPTNFETLSWNPTRNVPLYQVTVDLGAGSILVNFKNSVTYNVRGGSNSFHIYIKVYHPDTERKIESEYEKEEAIEIKRHPIEGAENKELAAVMNEARVAMVEKNYTRAVQLYTKVIQEGANSIYAKEALEFLGLARERKGQLAHAKAAYNQYLKLYPDGADAERVQQRLTGILTAGGVPKAQLRKARSKSMENQDVQWETYGNFSQFYNRDESSNNDEDFRVNRSSFLSYLNVSSRLRTEEMQLTGRFSGAYEYHLPEDNRNDRSRISSLYFDFIYQPWESAVRVGRQTRTNSGVLGRFDGILASVPVYEDIQLNLVAGYPVQSSRDTYINTDRYFYGVSADFGTYFKSWDFNVFFIEQIDHNVLDRRAVGGEIRYFDPNRSFFTYLDYDIHHNALNTYLFTGQWIFSDRTTVNLFYDYRRSPLLTTNNALFGQGVDNIEDLLNFFTMDEILEIANLRTGITKSAGIGVSRPFLKKFLFNLNFRLSDFSGLEAADGLFPLPAQPGTGLEYQYYGELTGNSLITSGDIASIGFRYDDRQRANTSSVIFNLRYPVTRDLRINPRFRFDMRDKNDGTTRWSIRPSMRVTYRILRNLQLELEAGGEWLREERPPDIITPNDPRAFDEFSSYYIFAGYRFDF